MSCVVACRQEREGVIRELIASPQLGRLLQDAYANYVMQSALMVTQVQVHQTPRHLPSFGVACFAGGLPFPARSS